MSLQGAPSVITLACVYFIPESPRWYIAHGDHDTARDLLVKYHGNGDPDSRIVDLEMRQMIEAINVDGADKRWWDWRSLFRTRADRVSTSWSSCTYFSIACWSSAWSPFLVNSTSRQHHTISRSW